MAGIFLLFAATAQAANFNVDSLADSGDGSLRAAIAAVNGAAGADTITITVPGTITLTSGELAITDSVIITGNAGGTTISQSGARVFSISSGSNVSLIGLTIQGGGAGGAFTGNGGGIHNEGACYLVNSTVRNHFVTGVGNLGGGIYNNGYLNIENSTINDNGAINGSGGGLYNTATGYGDILNSTISGNGASAGGGIYNSSSNPVLGLSIYNTTIALNIAPAAGGAGIATEAGLYLINTIVGANLTGGDCSLLSAGFSIEGDYNLESAATCNFAAPAQNFSIQNANPLLGALTVNAPGTTATHALGAGSPAINRGFNPPNITTDQRGVVRTIQFDIGAYESADAPFIDLSVFKAGPNVPVDLGAEFDFNIQVANLTDGTTATNVVVTDTLDPKLSFVSALPDICSAAGQVITCNMPDVVGGSFQAVTVRVVSLQGGLIDNSVSVAGGQIDEDLTNNINSFTVEVFYPLPVITDLDPVSTLVQSPSFTLTVNGTDFADLAVVRWSGSDLLTTFVNTTQLTAEVPSGLLTQAVATEITVFNPEPGGGSSNGVIINVYNPQPVLISISPTEALSGRISPLLLVVNGSDFRTGARVMWNGTPLATTFLYSGLLQALVPVQNLSTPGTATVHVENSAPAIGISNEIGFLINQGYHLFLPLAAKP
jgi:uncharacterized repeat protein (TIGR01451 family)